ncbi:hypothetical protein BN1013_02062 [Candidatus Rubidus massiliensis]|nr:hypothetical protein BN1013_02062 [Candidatus Rubidus massiliensis]
MQENNLNNLPNDCVNFHIIPLLNPSVIQALRATSKSLRIHSNFEELQKKRITNIWTNILDIYAQNELMTCPYWSKLLNELKIYHFQVQQIDDFNEFKNLSINTSIKVAHLLNHILLTTEHFDELVFLVSDNYSSLTPFSQLSTALECSVKLSELSNDDSVETIENILIFLLNHDFKELIRDSIIKLTHLEDAPIEKLLTVLCSIYQKLQSTKEKEIYFTFLFEIGSNINESFIESLLEKFLYFIINEKKPISPSLINSILTKNYLSQQSLENVITKVYQNQDKFNDSFDLLFFSLDLCLNLKNSDFLKSKIKSFLIKKCKNFHFYYEDIKICLQKYKQIDSVEEIILFAIKKQIESRQFTTVERLLTLYNSLHPNSPGLLNEIVKCLLDKNFLQNRFTTLPKLKKFLPNIKLSIDNYSNSSEGKVDKHFQLHYHLFTVLALAIYRHKSLSHTLAFIQENELFQKDFLLYLFKDIVTNKGFKAAEQFLTSIIKNNENPIFLNQFGLEVIQYLIQDNPIELKTIIYEFETTIQKYNKEIARQFSDKLQDIDFLEGD